MAAKAKRSNLSSDHGHNHSHGHQHSHGHAHSQEPDETVHEEHGLAEDEIEEYMEDYQSLKNVFRGRLQKIKKEQMKQASAEKEQI